MLGAVYFLPRDLELPRSLLKRDIRNNKMPQTDNLEMFCCYFRSELQTFATVKVEADKETPLNQAHVSDFTYTIFFFNN